MSVGGAPSFCAANEDAVSICIVNNMPGAVLRTTEQQFREVIRSAAGECHVRLRFFSLPDHRRGENAQTYVKSHYEDLATLLSGDCDGLIVTGTEPRAALLTQEPFWPALAALIEWAEDHTSSVIFLCLAAHAAVEHLDGINRRRLPKKVFGLFACDKTRDDTLLAGCPPKWVAPHSRSNDVMESELLAKGYSILSRSPQVGADIFAKPSGGRSQFIFMQGHLEYDTGALLEEYRREVRRFFTGKRAAYPELPINFFDAETERQLLAFQAEAMTAPDIRWIEALRFSGEMRNPCSWRPLAVRIYANWIADLAQRKASVTQGRAVVIAE